MVLWGWDEIAAYLRVAKTTAQKWRDFYGFPAARASSGRIMTTEYLIGQWILMRQELQLQERERRRQIKAQGGVTIGRPSMPPPKKLAEVQNEPDQARLRSRAVAAPESIDRFDAAVAQATEPRPLYGRVGKGFGRRTGRRQA